MVRDGDPKGQPPEAPRRAAWGREGIGVEAVGTTRGGNARETSGEGSRQWFTPEAGLGQARSGSRGVGRWLGGCDTGKAHDCRNLCGSHGKYRMGWSRAGRFGGAPVTMHHALLPLPQASHCPGIPRQTPASYLPNLTPQLLTYPTQPPSCLPIYPTLTPRSPAGRHQSAQPPALHPFRAYPHYRKHNLESPPTHTSTAVTLAPSQPAVQS